MARGTQFGQLVTMLRNEAGRSNTAGSAGLADYGQLKQLLNKHYETLYADYDWPHLRQVFARISLSAGERYYNVPPGLDYERIERIVVWDGGRPIPIERGIDYEEYSIFSSEDNNRSGPVSKWDIRFTGTIEQIEVWPMPSDNVQTLQITGFRKFTRLIADADVCRLDDMLVVGFAAGELIAKQDPKEAQATLAAAQTLYDKLRSRVKGASKDANFGVPSLDQSRKTFTVTVR